MDEVRLDQGTRSPDWIWESWITAAQNQNLAGYAQANLQPAFLSLSMLSAGLVANWAASGVGLVIYTATNLVSPTLWSRVTNLPSLITGQWQITFPPDTNATRFFRLESQ
jgi:hypothetical protein